MPCNADYMNPSTMERNLSQVACLLDELAGKKWTDREWDGYHPSVYNKPIDKALADQMVSTLCAALTNVDVTTYSLEMQTWWRDHQAADKARYRSKSRPTPKFTDPTDGQVYHLQIILAPDFETVRIRMVLDPEAPTEHRSIPDWPAEYKAMADNIARTFLTRGDPTEILLRENGAFRVYTRGLPKGFTRL